MSSTARAAAALREAAAADRPVRVVRRIRGADRLEGFVAGVGEQWFLLALLDDVVLDGYAALRLADVRRVDDRGGAESLAVRALRVDGCWPPPRPEPFDLDDLRGLLASAACLETFVALHRERDRPGECRIGRPVDLRRRSAWLAEITPDAEWEAAGPLRHRYDRITRVDFGGRYERALARFAAAPPLWL